MDKAGGGDNPEGATDTRVGNSSRAAGGRLGMGDSVAASEGGADEAALQAQRKRPRTSSLDEVAQVRQRLLACAFPGVQDNTSVPQLKVLLFEHGLATRLVCPEQELWKANGMPAASKWHGVHVACAWKAWLDSQETPAALLRRGVDAGASAPTTRGAAEHETAGCGEAGGGFKDTRRAAGERGSAAPHTDLPQRLVVWDRLSAAYARLKGSTHRDKIEVLQKLSVRLSKLHLSFEVPRAQAQDAPRWHYEMEVMFGALHGLDFVHVTAGLLADHMVDRHFGVDSCDEECEGGRLCHQYGSLENRFQEKLALRVEELLDHKVFAALWDLFDEGILGAVIDVQVAISEVHIKLVGSLQLKQNSWQSRPQGDCSRPSSRHVAAGREHDSKKCPTPSSLCS